MTTHGLEDERPRQRTQADVVEFGRRAVEGAALEDLLAAAAHDIGDSLDVQFVKVLEYQPDEKNLLVRAGIGWNDDVIGHATVGAEIQSPAGYALQTGQPVIANDLDREERFRIPELLRDHQVRSAVNVIIRNRSHVYGVLEADSRHPRTFDEEDVKFLQGYSNILSLAIEQKRLSEQNLHYAQLQETYFKELQHRIKNNNQQLISLINLQLEDVTSHEARENLKKIATRIMALSRVNEQLQSGLAPDRVDLGQYLLAVVASLFDFHSEIATEVRLETEICTIDASTDQAQAIGLIVNEFLTNSFKHAFQGGGTFRIRLDGRAGEALLLLADDGPGRDDQSKAGLGLRLIEALVRQLGATTSWSAEGGTRLEMSFPLDPGRP